MEIARYIIMEHGQCQIKIITSTYFLGPLALGFLANSDGSSDSRDLPLVLKSLCALSSRVLLTHAFKNTDISIACFMHYIEKFNVFSLLMFNLFSADGIHQLYLNSDALSEPHPNAKVPLRTTKMQDARAGPPNISRFLAP